MARYILLLNYTQQGISKVKESPHRAEAARALVQLRKILATRPPAVR